MIFMHTENQDTSIFRAYDIRGVYGRTIDEKTMEGIGRAFAPLVEGETAVVARDGRSSGDALARAFMKGLAATGKNAAFLGVLPLGAGMYHAWRNGMTFAYITASHLSGEWNGAKFFSASGIGFMEEDLEKVKQGYLSASSPLAGQGSIDEQGPDAAKRAYISHLHSKIRPQSGTGVCLDPGNGAASGIARELFERAGFTVTAVADEVDGGFPSRSPDPVEDGLDGLRGAMKGCGLGIAYDGDGDRMVVLDEKGTRLSPEQVAYIMLKELLKKQDGPVVANVETTRTIDNLAQSFGRQVHRVKVGHNHLMKGAHDKRACFGLEPSGHYSVPSIFPFDDSLAISYYFACLLSRSGEPLSQIAKEVPVLPFRRVNFDVPDSRKFTVMDGVKQELTRLHDRTSTLDGVRVDLDRGWVLIRPSNTQPMIRLTAEADTRKDLESLLSEFSSILEKYINQ